MNNRISRGARSRTTTAAGNAGRQLWIAVGLVVAVALAVAIAIASTSGDNASTTPQAGAVEVGFAESIGQSLAPYGGAGDTSGLGLTAPTITAQSMWTGDVVDIDVHNGQVHVIGFFAHWCPHCQREVPKVTAWSTDNRLPDGVEVVAVSTSVDDGAPNYPPSAWFAREAWPYTVLVDSADSRLARAYGLASFPYWVVVGPDGTVADQVAGEMTDTEFDDFMARAAALAG